MKKIFKRVLPLLLAVIILAGSVSVSAATYQSIPKNPQFKYGVDVSQWNDDLDWDRLRNAGVEFAFIRVGYYHSDGGTLDTRFKQNLKACVESGIDFGIYVYSYVYKKSENINCAKWVHKQLKAMGNYTKDRDTIPVAYDIEDDAQEIPVQTGRITKRYLTDSVQGFCDQIKSYGYIPTIYSAEYYYLDNMYVEDFQSKGVKIWDAQWPYVPKTKSVKRMLNGTVPYVWQFSDNYTIDSTVFDTNICYEDFYDYSKEDSTLTAKGLNYSYNYKKGGVSPKFDVYDGDTLLKKGTDYKLFYFSNKSTGKARAKVVRFKNGKYLETKNFIYYIKPTAVKNLTAKASYDEITLKWDEQKGAAYYEILEYDPTDGTYNSIDTTKDTTYTDTFLDEGTLYKIKVRAVSRIDGKKIYGTSKLIEAYTMYRPATLTSVRTDKQGQASLSWLPRSKTHKGYIIEYSKDKNFKSYSKLKIKSKAVTFAEIDSLDSKTTYYFRVKSYNVIDGKAIYSKPGTVKSITVK